MGAYNNSHPSDVPLVVADTHVGVYTSDAGDRMMTVDYALGPRPRHFDNVASDVFEQIMDAYHTGQDGSGEIEITAGGYDVESDEELTYRQPISQ